MERAWVTNQQRRHQISANLARSYENDVALRGRKDGISSGAEQISRGSPGEDAWVKKQARVNTRLTYTSTRYGLAAEDFEGGARLLTLCLERSNYSLNYFASDSATADSVGFFDTESTKLGNLLISLAVLFPEAALSWNRLLHKRCLSSTQLIGFHLRRSLGIKRLRRFPYTLISALVCEFGVYPEAIYVHLCENEALAHSTVKQVASIERPFENLAPYHGVDILGDVFRSLKWNDSCFRCTKRLAQMGFHVYESTVLREAAFYELENNFHGQTSHTLGRVLDLVEMLGPALACSVPLLSRVLHYFSSADYSDSDEIKLVRVYARSFLPCMSRVATNPMLNNLLWELLSKLSFARRGKVYSSTRKLSDRWPAALKESHRQARVATLRILRRLSRENIKIMGRKLGKLMTRFPLTSSVIILEQVEAYPNMIQPVVEALKYCGSLALDILLHELLCRLSIGRDKLKSDGQHVATWFSSLCSFTGAFCKRFRVELSAIILYIIRTLEHGQSFDLLILRELISSMSGISVLRDVSEESMLSLSGGPCLKESHNQSNHTSSFCMKSSARLKAAMSSYVGTESLAYKLLVLIAKCRQNIVQNTQEDQPKFVSQWFDECHLVLLQFVSFLRHAYTSSERVSLLPDATEMCEKYRIEPAIVYHILRQNIIDMTENPKGLTQSSDQDCRLTMVSKDWKDTMPKKSRQYIASEMYFTFWGLELSDIFTPTEEYLKMEKKYEEKIISCEHMLRANNGDPQQLRNEVSRYCKILQDLRAERHAKEASVQKLKHALKSKVDKWITFEEKSNIALSLLQFMILPRVKLSRVDAHYAACFVYLLHELDVPMFNTLWFYDDLFRSFQSFTFSCSQLENSQMGIFMSCSLSQLAHWLKNSSHPTECDSRQVSFSTNERTFIGSVHYELTFYNWQARLTKAFIAQLSEVGFMELRNALEVLVCTIAVFPFFKSHGCHIRKRVNKLVNLEVRGDIRTIATRYLAMLKSSELRWIADDLYAKSVEGRLL